MNICHIYAGDNEARGGHRLPSSVLQTVLTRWTCVPQTEMVYSGRGESQNHWDNSIPEYVFKPNGNFIMNT